MYASLNTIAVSCIYNIIEVTRLHYCLEDEIVNKKATVQTVGYILAKWGWKLGDHLCLLCAYLNQV